MDGGAGAVAALRPVRLWPDHFFAKRKARPSANQRAHAHTAAEVVAQEDIQSYPCSGRHTSVHEGWTGNPSL